jgi:trehalose 6-phosphate synthase/phosphatase
MLPLIRKSFRYNKRVDMLSLLNAYSHAGRRLLLLDYDGTLVEFNTDPMAAKPNRQLLDVLRHLSDDPANTVAVISGRPGVTLQDWLGHLPLGFSAEHGFIHKKPGGEWKPIECGNDAWKEAVHQLMQRYTDSIPGSILEEKLSAMTWHWRAAKDQAAAAKAEQALLAELEHIAKPTHLRVLRIIRGNKVIEVHPSGYDKGTGAQYWLSQQSYDFVLAAGDDTTDEDMFRVMPEDSFIIKVGEKVSEAGGNKDRLYIDNPAAMRTLLAKLA